MVDERREDLLRRLSRIFKSTSYGGIARSRVPIGNVPFRPPLGTGREFLRGSQILYGRPWQTPGGTFSRLTSYAEFAEMDQDAIIASALDILSEEAVGEDEYGNILRIYSSNDGIQNELENLFYNTLSIESFLWMWCREMCKFGDFFLMLDLHEDHGLLGTLPIPANEVEREEGFDKDDPFKVRFRWLTHTTRDLNIYEVAHFRLLNSTYLLPYGRSSIDQARRIWRNLVMLEDAMLIYRLVRAPERRMFFIDVANIDPSEVENFMKNVMEQIKANQLISSTGTRDYKYNALSVLDDLFIPVRGGETGTRVDSLAGQSWGTDLEDVEYFRKKMIAALKIPAPFLGYDEAVSSRATLSSEDVRFGKTIRRIQNTLLPELYKMAVVHLYIKGYRGDELLNYKISLASPSNIAELQNLEIWRTRLEVASAAAEGIFSKDFIYRVLFKLSDEQIRAMYESMLKEKLITSKIDQAEYTPPEEEAGKAAKEPEGRPEEGGEEEESGEEEPAGMIPPTEEEAINFLSPLIKGERPFGNKSRTGASALEPLHRSGFTSRRVTPDDGFADPYDRKKLKVRKRMQDRIMDTISSKEDIQKILSEVRSFDREDKTCSAIDRMARRVDSIDKLAKLMDQHGISKK